MKPALLDQLRDTISRQPTRLNELHAQIRECGSSWNLEQLRLLLEVYDGFRFDDPTSTDPVITLGEISPEEGLIAAVRQILNAEPDRPMPIARVVELLPAGITSSVEQLRALAAKTGDFEIRGPMMRRKAGA